jgi:hypothetical protein
VHTNAPQDHKDTTPLQSALECFTGSSRPSVAS